MEMLVSGAVCGFLYALFAGQPLTIVGATGPMLVFESIVFRICKYERFLCAIMTITTTISHDPRAGRQGVGLTMSQTVFVHSFPSLSLLCSVLIRSKSINAIYPFAILSTVSCIVFFSSTLLWSCMSKIF